jgi:hypothetical protein
MSKTPEEMAQQYISTIADTHSVKTACEKAFMAGYKAAQETYKVAIETFEEVAQQMMNEAVQITSSNDQEEK